MKNFLTAFLYFSLLSSCQTPGVVIEESDYSVKDHRKAIIAAIGEPRHISSNGREVVSQFHDRQFKTIEMNPKTKERLFTKVTILGARRPYDIATEVHIEELDSQTKVFLDVGIDEELSQKRSDTVRQMLNQSRDRLQSVDGEAPF